jgi:hypothetical protein
MGRLNPTNTNATFIKPKIIGSAQNAEQRKYKEASRPHKKHVSIIEDPESPGFISIFQRNPYPDSGSAGFRFPNTRWESFSRRTRYFFGRLLYCFSRVKENSMRQPAECDCSKSPDNTIAPEELRAEPFCSSFSDGPGYDSRTGKSAKFSQTIGNDKSPAYCKAPFRGK